MRCRARTACGWADRRRPPAAGCPKRERSKACDHASGADRDLRDIAPVAVGLAVVPKAGAVLADLGLSGCQQRAVVHGGALIRRRQEFPRPTIAAAFQPDAGMYPSGISPLSDRS